jgi:hypothetical protein
MIDTTSDSVLLSVTLSLMFDSVTANDTLSFCVITSCF